MDQLFPHSLGNVAYGLGNHPLGLPALCKESLDARRDLAALLSEGEIAPVVQVLDRAVPGESDLYLCRTAQHGFLAEHDVQRVHVADSIEDRKDRGPRTDSRAQRIDRPVQVIRLAAQQSDVIAMTRAPGRNDPNGQRGIPELAFDPQAIAPQRLGATIAHEKRHV